MLAYEHTNTLGPLAAALNVCTAVLARSAEIYLKLYHHFGGIVRHPASHALVHKISQWVQEQNKPRHEDELERTP